MIRSPAARLDSIDLMRGLVIVIMVLDHVRDFFHASGQYNPLDLTVTDPTLYATRWITHFCAPTFVFLAGVSIWLRADDRGGRGLSGFLLTRGLWLVLLEVTVVGFGWQLWGYSLLFLQVIWAIGVSMVVLAALCRAPANVVLGIGLLILLGHNALDGVATDGLGAFGPAWTALKTGGIVTAEPMPVLFAYPLVPWIGVMLVGFGFGRVFTLPTTSRHRTLTVTGVSMIAAFVVLRGFQIYGDPGGWQVQDASWKTVGDILDVQKYPPSLLFLLITLGPVLALLPWLERARGPVVAFLLPFGRAPLFAYVVHIYLAHLLVMAVGSAMGIPALAFINPFFDPQPQMQGWGLSLPSVYAVWAVVVVLVYVPTRWFAGVKARRRDWWLSYL